MSYRTRRPSWRCANELYYRNLCIGFCGEYFLHQELPGEYLRSVAYYSNGSLTKDMKSKDGYGKRCSKSDTIGCSIDWENSQFFFTLNGIKLGIML